MYSMIINNPEKHQLYFEFLDYIWISTFGKSVTIEEANEKFYNLFYMLKRNSYLTQDAKQLLEWMDKENNGKLPVNIEIMFNEWLLQKKL